MKLRMVDPHCGWILRFSEVSEIGQVLSAAGLIRTAGGLTRTGSQILFYFFLVSHVVDLLASFPKVVISLKRSYESKVVAVLSSDYIFG